MDVEDHSVIKADEEETPHREDQSIDRRLLVDDPLTNTALTDEPSVGHLSFRETAKLSFEFCLLWVGALQRKPRTVLTGPKVPRM